jgi:hypothetical protein
MKTATLFLLALVALCASSCAVKGHAGRHSTGASLSTAPVSAGAAVKY